MHVCVISISQIRDRVTDLHLHTSLLLCLSHLPILSVFFNYHHSSSVLNLSPPNPFPTTPFPSPLIFYRVPHSLWSSLTSAVLCVCGYTARLLKLVTSLVHSFSLFFWIKGRKHKRIQRAHSDNERERTVIWNPVVTLTTAATLISHMKPVTDIDILSHVHTHTHTHTMTCTTPEVMVK